MPMNLSTVQIAGAITNFGDAAVLLLLSALIAAWLLWSSGRRASLLWCGAVVFCTGMTAVLKTYFAACPVSSWQMLSPSGHTSFSTLVYGGAALSLAAGPDRRRWQRLLLLGLALAWALAIGWSRVVIHAHSGPEVMLGLLIGGASLLVYGVLDTADSRRRFPPLLGVGLAMLMLLVVSQERGFNLESLFQNLAHWINQRTPLCPSVQP